MDHATHPLHTRLMRRTVIDEQGCWLWQGAVDRHGYGKAAHKGKTCQVHRLAYVTLGPEFDHSLTLDHTCRKLRCWNPDHLDPVTQRVNNMRGRLARLGPMGATCCVKGHEFSEANTYLRRRSTGRTERECRTCRADHRRRHRSRAA